MPDRPCPLCQSANTGGYPRTSIYVERGRVHIDDWRCHACGAFFEVWYYTREEMTEYHLVRRIDGNRKEWEGLPPRQCHLKHCKSLNVEFVRYDGPGHRVGTEILRYKCNDCEAVYLEYAQISDGKRLFWRLWSGRR